MDIEQCGAHMSPSNNAIRLSSNNITNNNNNIVSGNNGNTNTPPRKKKEVVVVIAYKECLKNHAASLGTTTTDGCGEFLPAGDDALRCSACGCHRNFHRREAVDDGGGGGYLPIYPCWGTTAYAAGAQTAGHVKLPQCPQKKGVLKVVTPQHPGKLEGGGDGLPESVNKKKRHRTKFTREQKEKMLAFAEKAGWKIQKLDEGLVQEFCQELGIKRRVLKVWMHNNKQQLAKGSDDINILSPVNDNVSNSNSSCC